MGYIVAKVLGDRIYVRKYQQDLTRQYSTAFVGKAAFGEGGSTIKGMFIPTLQMTFFRVLFLGMGLAYIYNRGGLQIWMYFSRDALIHPDFREVMKRNQRNPQVIWLQYNKRNDEILRHFYQGKIVNYDLLKGFTQ